MKLIHTCYFITLIALSSCSYLNDPDTTYPDQITYTDIKGCWQYIDAYYPDHLDSGRVECIEYCFDRDSVQKNEMNYDDGEVMWARSSSNPYFFDYFNSSGEYVGNIYWGEEDHYIEWNIIPHEEYLDLSGYTAYQSEWAFKKYHEVSTHTGIGEQSGGLSCREE
ncbi:MAG: hypothetical protein OCC49_19385 [Fibrobacterales bacterium]